MEHSYFAMELKYSLDDLMDCVCTHNFMGDEHIFFSYILSKGAAYFTSGKKNAGSKYQHSSVQRGGKYFPKYVINQYYSYVARTHV